MANSTGTLTYEVNGTSKTISLLNEETGDMRSTFDILSDIADDWDTMSLSEQQAIGIALAGGFLPVTGLNTGNSLEVIIPNFK